MVWNAESAAILALLTASGFGLTFFRLNRNMRRKLLKYPILVDAILTVVAYILLGETVTAIFAAGIISVVISILLYIYTGYNRLTESWLARKIESLCRETVRVMQIHLFRIPQRELARNGGTLHAIKSERQGDT